MASIVNRQSASFVRLSQWLASLSPGLDASYCTMCAGRVSRILIPDLYRLPLDLMLLNPLMVNLAKKVLSAHRWYPRSVAHAS